MQIPMNIILDGLTFYYLCKVIEKKGGENMHSVSFKCNTETYIKLTEMAVKLFREKKIDKPTRTSALIYLINKYEI